MLHAVIMAGGSGTRFWPESRRDRPKQLLPITGRRAMLAETVLRLDPLVPCERVCVVTNERQAAGVRAACPELPARNVLEEPCARNTAACVAYAAAVLRREDSDATMIMLPADHVITPEERFRQALAAAAEAAQRPGALLTFGITPTHPATGYGYIRGGAAAGSFHGHACHLVDAFVEKPDEETARRFLAEGGYWWNSGMFVWRADTILEEIERLLPEFAAGAARIGAAWGGGDFAATLREVYLALPSLPVDVGVMEKAASALVIPGDFHWTDVGSWRSLHEELEHDASGNAAVLPAGGELVALDAHGVLAYSSAPQTIAVLGLDDVIVVRTPDAVLVAHRDRAEDVKRLVDTLRDSGREDLL